MKKYLLSSAVAAAIFATGFAGHNSASAQPGVSPGMPLPNVALVDVGYILKNHVRLKAQRAELKAEADKMQQEFEAQMKAVQEKSKQLGPGGYKIGSPEYTQLEEQLVKEQSAIKTSIQLKQREFIQRESHLLFNAYTEVNQEVRAYCVARGIALVLNFNHEAVRDDSPDNIARGISNPVVYFNRQLDITPDIMPPFIRPLPPAGGAAFTPPTQR